MRAAGRRGRGKRRFKSTTDSDHALPVAENLLMRQFEMAEPNLVWAADMTFLRTTEGWLYLAVVQGLYSRKIVGWSMGSRMSADLPLTALRMAFHQRHPAPGLMHHSDRGSQYASKVYQHALKGMQMTCSQRDGVLLRMHAQAPIIACQGRLIRGATGATTLIAIFDAEGRTIITGADDAIFHYNQRSHLTAQAT